MDVLIPPLPPPVRKMFTPEGTESFVSETLGATAWVRNSGVFSGFGVPIGIRGPFNRIKFYIFPFDSGLVPSTVRARIRAVDYQGAILGDATVPVGPVFNQGFEVVVDFASTINSAGQLWFEFFTDGRTGDLQVGAPDTDYPLASFPQARYSTDANPNNPAVTTQFTPSFPTAGALQGTEYVGFYLVGEPKTVVLSEDFNRHLNNETVLADLFTFDYEFLNTSTSGPLSGSVWSSESSIFSGHASLVGAQPAFQSVRFIIRAWDASAPITKVRCRIKLNDSNGTVVGDKTISITTQTGVATPVTFDFGSEINQGSTPLWLEYMTDGHTGLFVIQPILFPSVNRRYWINENVDTPGPSTEISGGALNQNIYVAFGRVTSNVVAVTPTSMLSNALNITAPSGVPTVSIDIPSILYAVEGIEFNVYWQNIIRSTIGIDQLQIDVTCTKGTQWDRFWRITPVLADAGSISWVLSIYYGGQLITSKTCTLVIKAKSVGGGATRKVLFIGDSTTIDGRPIAEMARLDATFDTNLTLSFQGSKTISNKDDSTGVDRGSLKCEAISGWSINLFYTDPTSPFIFAGVFNFATYLSTNSITMASNDWVLIHLGINDIFSYTDDINLNVKINEMTTQLDAIIAQIQAAISGVRIGLLLTIPAGDQNSFGQAYGSGQTSWRFDRNRAIWVETMLQHYDGRQASKIFVFPYNSILDVPYNCQVLSGGAENGDPVVVSQNALQPSLTFQVSFNGVHPASFGYWQMGQAAWAFLKAQES